MEIINTGGEYRNECIYLGNKKIAQTCAEDILPEIEISGFVESIPGKRQFLGKNVISGKELCEKTYDYVVMANSHAQEIIKDFSLDESKVVYYFMDVSVETDRGVVCKRKNTEKINGVLFKSEKKLKIVEEARKVMPDISVHVDDLKFLFDSNDNLISNEMLAYNETYSKDEMHFLYNTAPLLNGGEQGIFLDIGANIGTTSIYFRKKMLSKLKYIAFEPLKVNYRFLKMNCIQNDCEDIICENIGCSNVNEQRKMYLYNGAYGSSMISDDEGTECCDFMKLDDYVLKNDIQVDNISYIWIDVQGHELQVVQGAKNTLINSSASLFIEFNVRLYKKTEGKAEAFLNLLAGIYKSFIVYEQYAKGKTNIRSIEELLQLPEEIDMMFCNILLMK